LELNKIDMKKLLTASILLAVILLALNFPNEDFPKNSDKGIRFYQGTWNEALELAQKENKIIFLDIYATWCRPCKMLKSKTFSEEEVGAFYNQNFINMTIDGEKGQGAVLARKYGIKAYPSLLFIDSNGRLISGATGYHAPKKFIRLGKKVLK
jgi:thioredoxin 1